VKYLRGLYDALNNNAYLTNLVDNRIYPNHAPSGAALPFIVYETIGSTTTHSKTKAEVAQVQVEVVGYSATFAEAADLVQAIQTALRRQRWAVSGSASVDNVFIQDEAIEFIEDPDRYAAVCQFELFVQYK
jgi:hypothetical protein